MVTSLVVIMMNDHLHGDSRQFSLGNGWFGGRMVDHEVGSGLREKGCRSSSVGRAG